MNCVTNHSFSPMGFNYFPLLIYYREQALNETCDFNFKQHNYHNTISQGFLWSITFQTAFHDQLVYCKIIL